MFDRVGIVGVGLIGASVGLCLKKRRLCRSVLGVGRSSDSLATARRCGAIDETAVGIGVALADVDFLLVCTPVGRIAEHVEQASQYLADGTVMTDAGSTKAAIVRALQELLGSKHPFVGSHPLAGSELRGPAAGDPDLFEGKTCIVTPTGATDLSALERVREFWRSLGMQVLETSPEVHDRTVGRTSHLPHLVACALTLQLQESDHMFSGSGLRDTSRIASGDPGLWTQIFAQNRNAVLKAVDAYQICLEQLRSTLANEDYETLERLLSDGKRIRDAVGN